MHKKTKINIGIDLDGVIIGKPPFVPGKLIEWLYRSHNSRKLGYRFPGRHEQYIRILSHHPLMRPPIGKNIDLIRKLTKDKRYNLFAVSSRYSFLVSRTNEWIGYYKIDDLFSEIYLNTKDEQPHLFKEKIIAMLKIDILVDDDEALIRYLKRRHPHLKTILIDKLTTTLRSGYS